MVVYPLEFYRSSELQWKRRVKAAAQSQRDEPSTNRGNETCPNCRLPVSAPFVSEYRSGCVVEHHWLCRSCDFHWTTRFDPLLV
jgi:transposase-like protein